MELRHLRYFVAVAEEGHITRAAERLGIQQPPLSQQIKALEGELGVRLFRRRPRGVELTEVGEVFFEDARGILEDVERALARVRRTARGEQGRVVLGLTSSATFHPLVQGIIRQFRDKAPGISLALRESGSAELAQALRSDRLDVAFVRVAPPRELGFAAYLLAEEPMVAAFPLGHSLAAEGDTPLPLADLADQPFVLYRRATGAGLYDSIIAACNAAGFVPRTAQEAPWVGATLNLVAAGLGVTLVPESFCRMHLEGIVYRRLAEHESLTARIFLVSRRGAQSPAAGAFIALARAAAPAPGPTPT
mgnify:FL=1